MAVDVASLSIVRQLLARGVYAFTPRLVSDWFGLDLPHVYRLVARLKRQSLIAEVEKGKYLVLGLEPERVLANPLFVAGQLVTPGYVSYWSALHYHGFTEQVPIEVFVATTRKKRPVRFHGYRVRFVSLRRRKFFGYQRVMVAGLPVLIADEAKAIVDSLDQPRLPARRKRWTSPCWWNTPTAWAIGAWGHGWDICSPRWACPSSRRRSMPRPG